ncbi:hypothetical protein [Flavobacterium endophyticum]|uniref:hypothetical protein n=1 Tax=Flavobacterium endophyticum TaxID=1540163 RepID=UPI000EAF0A2E|nr:hypothetical protein [Flavobacterium endophyticum]
MESENHPLFYAVTAAELLLRQAISCPVVTFRCLILSNRQSRSAALCSGFLREWFGSGSAGNFFWVIFPNETRTKPEQNPYRFGAKNRPKISLSVPVFESLQKHKKPESERIICPKGEKKLQEALNTAFSYCLLSCRYSLTQSGLP